MVDDVGILKNVKKSFLDADVDGSGFLDEDEFKYVRFVLSIRVTIEEVA